MERRCDEHDNATLNPRDLRILGFIVGLAACAPIGSDPAPAMASPAIRPMLSPGGAMDTADVRVTLVHYPAIGIKSAVKVHFTETDRVLEVIRSVGPGYAAYWRIRFKGARTGVVDEVVARLVEAAKGAVDCPRRHGRDGVAWGVMTLPERNDHSVDFHHGGGSGPCHDFERFADELMRLAQLTCTAHACLRPRELSEGKLECVAGSHGDDCRMSQKRFNLRDPE